MGPTIHNESTTTEPSPSNGRPVTEGLNSFYCQIFTLVPYSTVVNPEKKNVLARVEASLLTYPMYNHMFTIKSINTL